MNAVAEADRARFERHLARCQACERELRGLREATARLAAAAAAEPPAGLIQRALAAAERTPQLPPVTGETPPRRRTRQAGLAAGAAFAAGPGRAGVLGRAWRAIQPRLALAVAAVFVAAGTASGVLALGAEHRLGQARLSDHAIAAVLTAPDAEMLTDIRQAAERYDLPAELTGSVPAEPPGVAGLYTDPGGQEGVRYWGGGEWSPLLPADLDGDKQVPTFPGKVSGSLPGPDGSWQYAARQAKNETVWSGVFAGATAVCLGIALVGHWGVACRHRVLRTRCIWCLDYA